MKTTNTSAIKAVGAVLGALLFLSGCVPPRVRQPPLVEAARFCVVMDDAIRLSRKDVFTDGTFEQIAALNAKWESLCEKKEGGK
jgi:hypothetical protein